MASFGPHILSSPPARTHRLRKPLSSSPSNGHRFAVSASSVTVAAEKDWLPADIEVTEVQEPNSRVRLSVEVPPVVCEDCYRRVFKEFMKQAKIFRLIDSGSVKGFPKSVEEAAKQNLICGKNLKVDKSIHTAYVKAIRSAQHFICIENQYFLGSSYHWPSYKNAGANNLVPMELALKITSKISENERFCGYIVIQMWPEGVPTSAAV